MILVGVVLFILMVGGHGDAVLHVEEGAGFGDAGLTGIEGDDDGLEIVADDAIFDDVCHEQAPLLWNVSVSCGQNCRGKIRPIPADCSEEQVRDFKGVGCGREFRQLCERRTFS